MSAGRLTINAGKKECDVGCSYTVCSTDCRKVTIRGLAEAGFADSRTFVGCYIVPTDKHRTQSDDGPEPRWNHTLYW